MTTNNLNPSATTSKLALDDNLSKVFAIICSKACPDPIAAVRSLLNLHREPAERCPEGLSFDTRTVTEHVVEMAPKAADFVMKELITKYYVQDQAAVQMSIRQQWVKFNDPKDRVQKGQFYTTPKVAELFKEQMDLLLGTLPKDTVILDPAAGTGNLTLQFPTHRTVNCDIDAGPVAILQELGCEDVVHGNSLLGASRRKFHLKDTDSLVLGMNPPFNNQTSMHHRDLKAGHEQACDQALKCRDLAGSFLKLGVALGAKGMVVIHPFALLSKATNFKGLGKFTQKFRLNQGVLVSSAEFGLKGTPFAVLIGTYLPGSMSYEDVRQMELPIYRTVDGDLLHQGELLKLAHANPNTTKLIRSSVPTKEMPQDSQVGLHIFNFRDINNVMSSAGFTTVKSSSTIPIQMSNLGHYAYIHCMRRYLPPDFAIGNLDPLVRQADLDNTDFMDACIYDTVMANPKLAAFDRTNLKSFVVTHGLLAAARQKAQAFATQAGAQTVAKTLNAHQCFVDYWTQGTGADALQASLKAHFVALKKVSIVTRKTAVATVMGTSRVGTLSRVAGTDRLAQLAIAAMHQALGIAARPIAEHSSAQPIAHGPGEDQPATRNH
jgi:predicted RNA methylase